MGGELVINLLTWFAMSMSSTYADNDDMMCPVSHSTRFNRSHLDAAKLNILEE